MHILPLEDAIRDLTGQLALRRQAQASSAYQTLFAPSRDTRGVRREYRQAYLALEKERSKALAAMLDPTPEHIKTLNEQFDAQQEKLRAMYLKVPNAEQSNRAAAWAQGDETKQRF
ncbi:hypothetical protein [Vibrio penaeicida]|uniref:hypothetical protein n=1 Tax=Vibrio penaeicida TaxID=104609 RepID=UPI001CC7892A|nr:hypothetical protein [Vibrio penaeicida]